MPPLYQQATASSVRPLLDAIVLGGDTDAALQVEILALRHQLRVLNARFAGAASSLPIA